MGTDNRTVTVVDWPGSETPGTTPPQLNAPRYTDVNAWQDRGTLGVSNFNQCGTFSGWEGAVWQYGQRSTISTGSAKALVFVNPWDYASVIDLRGRVMVTRCWTENNADELPDEVNYNPDTFLNAPVWNLWYTSGGSADGAPPPGIFWTPWANIYLYSNDDGQSLKIYNNTGATIHFCMSTWIFEKSVGGDPGEKRIWTQNPYECVWADRINHLQDYSVQQGELDQTTLAPVNVFEGAALYYGQFTYGAAAATLVDDSRDWRERILLSYWKRMANLNQLPEGAAYDPDVAAASAWNLWSTEAGSDPVNPMIGLPEIAWNPAAGNLYLSAARIAGGGINPGELSVYNNGAITYGMLFTMQSSAVA